MLDRAKAIRPVFLESTEAAWDGVERGEKPDGDALRAAIDALRAAEIPQTKSGAPNKNWSKAIDAVAEAAQNNAWKEILEKGLGGRYLSGDHTYYNKPMSESLCQALVPIARRACYEFLTALRKRNLATRSLLESFETALVERKRERGAYRFEDLPLALAPRSGAGLQMAERELEMWFRLDGKIDHLLLDEFQDTSPVQWRILEQLAGEIAADGTGERSFFCVGDVKQSIYGFRQAEPRLLAELDTLLPGLQSERMNTSYRSSRIVLETVNRVFSNLEHNPAFESEKLAPYRVAARQWQAGFDKHEAARELPGATFVIEAPRPSEEQRVDETLLECTVERVRRIHAETPDAGIAILMRERKNIPALIYRLRHHGIDARGEGGNELVDSEAVLAFVSLLHLADHPGDSAAAFHVASSRFGDYVGLTQEADEEQRHAVARRIRERIVVEGLGGVCAEFARRVNDDESWSDWNRSRFSQLLDLAYAFEDRAGLRPSDFVEHVRSERVEAPGSSSVRVMTIHASKGLEFDAVILPELHKKLVGTRTGLLLDRPRPDKLIQTVSVSPDQNLLVADERLKRLYDQTTTRMVEDALCNLYVAMTRAARRLELILPWADPEKPVTTPTAADVVRCGLPGDELHAADESNVIWSHPDNSDGTGWAAPRSDEGRVPAELEAAITSLTLADSAQTRSLPRRSPSAEEGGRRVRTENLFRSRSDALRGTMVHAWLEELEWIETFESDEDQLLARGAALEPDLELRREALGELQQALTQDEIRQALSRAGSQAPEGATLEVSTERAFSVVLPDDDGQEQLWSGSIDRLVVARRDDRVVWAEVLDYKTDRVRDERLQQRVEFYRPQLEKYARVVAAQTGLAIEEISVRLVFLSAARVVDL
jgi:ATP-dependent exoDNAse (exonuclease V) beta subunit